MDEDGQVVVERELDVLLEDVEFVAGVLVEPDLADAEHGGRVEKVRDQAITSRAKPGSSASFGLMQSQQKCLMPNFAARFGSYSVSWRK